MVRIKFTDDGKIINGVMLCRYQRPHSEIYSVEKRFLRKIKTVYKKRTIFTPLYVVFIPWKHRMKEIVEIDEKYIVNPESLKFDEAWINIDKFISKSYSGSVCCESIQINNFVGYPFVYEKNNFLIDLYSSDNLTVLYNNLPEFLEIDLDNAVE